MVTSDPVRDRIVVFTRSMSAVTRSTRRSTDAEGWLSNGMTTATRSSEIRTDKHRNAIVERQVRGWPRSQMIRGPGAGPEDGMLTTDSADGQAASGLLALHRHTVPAP